MNNTETVNLGKLTLEDKQKHWDKTISGSQAWMLVNEPWNLLRDKLGVPRAHKSKYDFFKTQRGKNVGTSAMAQGTMYEATVIKELQEHYPDTPLVYDDNTYQLVFKDNDNNPITGIQVTSTPDYLTRDANGDLNLIGDAKCSTSATDEEIMMERYYSQGLHNCLVMGRVRSFELAAKGEITRPINRYQIEFTNEDFDTYQNKLLEFFLYLQMGTPDAYDSRFDSRDIDKLEKAGITVQPLQVYEADEEEAIALEELFLLKEDLKTLKEDVKAVEASIEPYEEYYKNSFDNLNIKFNDKELTMKATLKKGTVDNAKALKETAERYSLGKNYWDIYRKESTVSRTITIKGVKTSEKRE